MRIYRTFFAKKLRDALDRSDLNQRKLAEKVDVEPPSVSRWINGEDFPDEERLPRIAKALNLPKDYFEIENEELKRDGLILAAAFLKDFSNAPLGIQNLLRSILYRDQTFLKGVSRDDLLFAISTLSVALKPK